MKVTRARQKRGEKLRSIDDIAKIAGVSKSTVSRALNESSLVREETRERIKEIAREHGFEPSAVARSLSLRASHTMAFVTHAYSKDECGVSDPFSLEIMGGITIGLHELGYDLLVVHVDPRDNRWASHFLDSGRVDGFILMTSTNKRDHVNLLLSMGAPFVAWGISTGEYCTVSTDNIKGGRLAGERLVSTGRRVIAFLGGTRTEAEVIQRHSGFAAALQQAGHPLDPRLTLYADYMTEEAARATEELLRREPKLDAIFSNSDVMAVAAMRVILESGRKIPDDVAVIGYDDLSLASYVTPPLTTVSQKVPFAGKMLARDLVEYLRHGVITNTVVPVELIVRGTA